MKFKPGIYMHYKGKKYKALFLARDSETEEVMVVYQALYGDFGYWVRPLAMFQEQIEAEGIRRPRFRYIEGFTINRD